MLKKIIIKQISKELSLPFTGIEQDWDIEISDPNRIDDFLNFYSKIDLSSDEKFAVMSLIVASYEEFLNENTLNIDDRWSKIKLILESEVDIFIDLINYWSLSNEVDDLFKVTPLIRDIKY